VGRLSGKVQRIALQSSEQNMLAAGLRAVRPALRCAQIQHRYVGTIERHELLNVLQADDMDERFLNTYVFDVRQPEEIEETGALGPDVVNIPLGDVASGAFDLDGEDFEDKYGILKPDTSAELIFSCRAGVRSDSAARFAEQAGYGR
jgi:rhodanese-related sulfurtransferase